MKSLILSLFLFSSIGHANIGDEILDNYQSHLYILPLSLQEHFSTRLFIITGNTSYLNPLFLYMYALSERFKYLVSNLSNDFLIDEENKRLLTLHDNDAVRKKLRFKKIEEWNRAAFYLNLLLLIKKINYYKFEKTPLFPASEQGLNYIKSQMNTIEPFLVDEKTIKVCGAQCVNYVYYLYDLGVADLRKRFIQKFRKVFPDEEDKRLSATDYTIKIYALTHFIIASSNYYQNEADEQMLNWIIDYFEKNIDEIIRRTENDVIVEVGVCFMLMNKGHLNVVIKIKNYLESVYDKKHRMIPNKEHSFDLIKGEHRNVLTIMLFKWPQKINVIPDSLLMKMNMQGFVQNDANGEMYYSFNLL
ncbi:Domain of uncharacterised function (DUF3541) (plasmid) [Legionella adelaidensis]|uniref:Domain of uncharacterized function (DUF3541) n=1 Tax=Legionella adelaidensis TaxID=45056 RepID=A0A0W0R283_9GAMM|nr:DUF3541 domain-containing protein [Legionella adelaidensis]KTC65081.1 hypothetical protein Lade_1604 [Legionella adelaidensis]VEH85399.1 Domain of uncharacterised function (DUF3541) [Legionella adelaidensis]